MRGVAVPYAVLAAVLVLNVAVAQNDPGQPSSPSSPSAQTTGQADDDIAPAVWQAPIGHRQPSAKDVPPKVEEGFGHQIARGRGHRQEAAHLSRLLT